jgi:hypothetical protein
VADKQIPLKTPQRAFRHVIDLHEHKKKENKLTAKRGGKGF